MNMLPPKFQSIAKIRAVVWARLRLDLRAWPSRTSSALGSGAKNRSLGILERFLAMTSLVAWPAVERFFRQQK